MALTPEQQKLKDLKDLRIEFEAYRKEYESLSGKKMPNPFPNQDLKQFLNGFKDIETATKVMSGQIRHVRREINALDNDFDSVKSIVKDISNELQFNTSVLKNTRQQFSKIRGIVSEIEYINADIASASKDDIARLKQKNKAAFISLGLRKKELEAEIEAERGNLTNSQIAAGFGGRALKEKQELLSLTNDEIGLQTSVNNELDKQSVRITNINSGLGISGKIVEGLGGALEKLGFKGISAEVGKAQQKMKDLSFELSEAGEKTVGFSGKVKVLGVGLKSLAGSLAGMFTDPLFYVGIFTAAVSKLVKLFTHIDSAISDVAKGMGLTNAAATELTFELKKQAIASDEIGVSMDNLIAAQLDISKQLGTNVRLTGQQLEDQVFLNKFVGLQGESLKNSLTASLLLGKSQEDIFDTIVKNNDGVYQSAALFEEAVNTTGQIAVNLGNNPAKIAAAVREAKRLGINLDTARGMSNSILDFESSINAEMEASVLLGRSINLNHARELAFRNDHVGAAKEMLRQVGGMGKFGKMNAMQQQSLADAMGLSVDALADQLRMAEQDIKLTEQANKLRRENPALSQEEALLKARDENRTIGETINDITTRLSDIFGSLVKGPLKAVRELLSNSDKIIGSIREGFGAAFTQADNTGKSMASMIPSLEDVVAGAKTFGEFLFKAYEFAKSIPDRLKSIADNPIVKMLSSLLGSTGGQITLAAGGIGAAVMGGMKMMRGATPLTPMYVAMAVGGKFSKMLQKLAPKGLGKVLTKVSSSITKIGSSVAKVGTSILSKVAPKAALKAGASAAAKTGAKSAAKTVAKTGMKTVGKSLLKKIPGIGLIAGLAFAAEKVMKGDFAGAGLEVASGAASLIPGAGTALSVAIDAGIAARDISKATSDQKTEEQPLATKEQKTVEQPLQSGDGLGDFVIKSLPQDSLVMAGGTNFGKETNDLLRQLLAAINNGGDVMLDGVKVGSTLSAASFKL